METFTIEQAMQDIDNYLIEGANLDIRKELKLRKKEYKLYLKRIKKCAKKERC